MTGEELWEHMVKMTERLTWHVYRIVSVALFARHQLMFSFMLCTSIMQVQMKTSLPKKPVVLEFHVF